MGLFVHTMSVFDEPAVAEFTIPERSEHLKKLLADGTSELPESAYGASVVDADWITKHVAGEQLKIFDVRGKVKHVVHIPGSISVVFKENGFRDMKKVPVDREGSIVVYCDGADSWKSYEFVRWVVRSG